MRRLTHFLPTGPESLSDLLGVAAIGLMTVTMLWLPALIG